MKTYVVLLVQIDTAWVQYAGCDEDKARDVESFEDYDTFTESDGFAYFKMHIWEDGKGLYNETFEDIAEGWIKSDHYSN